ncbi:MAG: DJ-1/PfpI family protein [Endomicrobium sp.]|jgi:protease I|nr:DJ-1/PfpI family protein [Endomicrobium sp.]
MKKIVFVTAPEMFRDEEYYKPKEVLEKSGIKVITASTKTGSLTGRFGYKAASSILISEIISVDFDAVVYIGGNGANIFFENKDALKLANEFFEQHKPVAAICIAGVILANSGILKGRKATVYSEGIETLQKAGAYYTGNSLEIDGNIITANGPDAAQDFGKAILNILN